MIQEQFALPTAPAGECGPVASVLGAAWGAIWAD